jgi:hypothetical protein
VTRQGKPGAFVYYVPLPSVIRNIELAFAAFLTCLFIYIPYRWGVRHTFHSLQNDPLLWLILVAIFFPGAAFFLLLAFPPKSWSARIEADHDCIRLIPRPPDRWIGEPSTEIALGSQCRSITLCRGSVDRSRYGLRILVGYENRHQEELKINIASLTARQAKKLADGISAATMLPVDPIQRRLLDEGEMLDIPWAVESATSRLIGIGKMIFAVTPLLGGVAVGLSRASGTTAAIVGTFLWLAQTAGVMIASRFSHQRSKLALGYWLTTAFTFAASYAAVFLIIVNSLRAR